MQGQMILQIPSINTGYWSGLPTRLSIGCESAIDSDFFLTPYVEENDYLADTSISLYYYLTIEDERGIVPRGHLSPDSMVVSEGAYPEFSYNVAYPPNSGDFPPSVFFLTSKGNWGRLDIDTLIFSPGTPLLNVAGKDSITFTWSLKYRWRIQENGTKSLY